MAIRTIFANLSALTPQPLSLFDQEFADFANWVVLPCTASGTNVVTLTAQTYVPQLVTYGFYNIFSFIAPNTNTGPLFATYQPLGTLPVYYGNGTSQIGSGVMVSGQPYWLMYNPNLTMGTGGFYLISPGIALTPLTISATALVVGFSATVNSSSQLGINAYQAVLPNSDFQQSVFRSNIALLNTTTVSGANGLDVGAIANNNWYYIYLIDNGNAPATLISLSSTAPTLPSGYTYYQRVGAMYYGSGAWIGQQLNGPHGTWTQPTQIINDNGVSQGNINTPTWVAVQVRNGGAQAVPPTAIRIRGHVYIGGSNSGMLAPFNNYGGQGTSSTAGPFIFAASTSGFGIVTPFDLVLINNNLYWATVAVSGHNAILALGWLDQVPCF